MIIFYFQKVNVETVNIYIYAHTCSCKWEDGGHETKLQTLNLKKLQVYKNTKANITKETIRV